VSIKIHHGAPGSYKTAGAVQDDFIPAARKGRTIITNIRGLNDEENVRRVLNLQPDNTFKLIHLDDKDEHQLDKLRKWWHWAPLGALIMLDEIQLIYPKAWTQTKISKFDLLDLREEGADHSLKTLENAFDKHRHNNWDLILTTPSIKKIRPEIRDAAEMAYRHKDLSALGKFFSLILGHYVEASHLATDNGTSQSDIYVFQRRRINAKVWKLYQSTATGEFSSTIAGKSIFKEPKILLLLLLIAGLGTHLFTSRAILGEGDQTPDMASLDNLSATGRPTGIPAQVVAQGDNQVRPVRPDIESLHRSHPLHRYRLRIAGHTGADRYTFAAMDKTTVTALTKRQVETMGYQIEPHGQCLAYLKYETTQITVDCITEVKEQNSDPQDDSNI